MTTPKLHEGFLQWEIEINPDLKFARVEQKKKGIKWYWGRDNKGKYKLMYAYYPKTYSESQMLEILKKYDICPNCQIGRNNLKFKYTENNSTIMSLIDLFGKIPSIGSFFTKNKNFFQSFLLQGAATGIRYPLKLGGTELGARLANAAIGGIPSTIMMILDNMGKLPISEELKNELYIFFLNFLWQSVEAPNADSLALGNFGLSDDIRKLKGAIQTGNYFGVSDALIQNPAKLKAAARRLAQTVKMGNFGEKVASFFGNIFNFARIREGRLRPSEGTSGGRGSIPLGNFRASSQVADEFGYKDTGKRFRDISTFSSGFQTKKRFRIAGTGHEIRVIR